MCNMGVSDSKIEYVFKMIEIIWSELKKYTDIFDSKAAAISSIYNIRSLYEAKYISEEDIKILCNACCAFYDPKLGLDDERLRLDVLKRKNLDLVLCEIIFNAFGLIENAYNRNENNTVGLNTVQYLFRSLKDNYSANIVDRVV